MSLISVCSESVMQNLQPCKSIHCPYVDSSSLTRVANRSLKSSGQLNFSDPKAVMQLTKTLLKLDFGLETDLPDDRLCPPVRSARSSSMSHGNSLMLIVLTLPPGSKST